MAALALVVLGSAAAWGVLNAAPDVVVGDHVDAPELSAEPGAPRSTDAPQPALMPDMPLAEVRHQLAEAHYLLVASPRKVGEGAQAYAESWDERGWPKSYLLHFREDHGKFRLRQSQANPSDQARRACLGGDVAAISIRTEAEALAHVGRGAIRLDPAGPGGVALLGGKYRLDLRDRNGNPDEVGRLAGSEAGQRLVPLFGHLAQARQLNWAWLAEDESKMSLVELLPHSGLSHLIRLKLSADKLSYEPLP